MELANDKIAQVYLFQVISDVENQRKILNPLI
jgi:hypothetical protein